ncbi:MAG: exopolysaccharide production protein ExoQ [Acidimicrobiales bacterium]|jgi:exopolysaccharide production protein ExoQ
MKVTGGERLFATTALFIIIYGLPIEWFTSPGLADVQAGDLQQSGGAGVVVVFVAIWAVAMIRMVGHFGVIVELSKRSWPLVLLSLCAVLSTLWSVDPATTLRRSFALLITTMLAYYFVSKFSIPEFVRMAAWAILVGTALSIVWIVALPRFGQQLSFGGGKSSFTGVFFNKNVAGRFWTLATILLVFAARTDRPRRFLWWPLAVVNAVLVFFSNSATSLGTLTLTMALSVVYISFRSRKTFYGAVATSFLGAIVIAVLFVTVNLDIVAKVLGRDVTLTGRTELWGRLPPFLVEAVPVGSGFAAFWGPYLSPGHDLYLANSWLPVNAHNQLFDIWLDLGLVGAILYLLLLLQGVVRASRFVRLVPGASGLLPLAIISAVTITSITESGVVERNANWLLLAMSVLYVSAARRKDFLDAQDAAVAEAAAASDEQESVIDPVASASSPALT